MLESFLAVPLHFTVEFLGLLVFAGGAVLVLARPETLGGGGIGRYTVASGFLVLAVANIAHGANFEVAVHDGDSVLVALRATGLLLLAGGLSLPSRTASAAPAVTAFEIREPLLFLPATAAVAVAVAAAVRARRTGDRALDAIAAGALLLTVAETLTSVAPQADFSSGLVSVYAYGAHGAKLLGYIAVASWLGRSARKSLRTRFVAAFAALLVVVVLVLSTALTGVISNNVGEEQLRTVQSQLNTASQSIDADREDLLEETGQIANLSDVRRAVASGEDAQDLVRAIRTDLEFFQVDFVAVLDRNGRQLAFSKQGPTALNARGQIEEIVLKPVVVLSVLGSPVVGDLLNDGEGASSIDVIPKSSIVMELAGAQVTALDGSGVVGYLVTARWVDQLTVEAVAESFAPSEATLVIDDQVAASTLPLGVTAESLVPEEVRREFVFGGGETLQQTVAGESYFGAVAPLSDALGNPTSATLSLSAPSSVVANTREDVIRVLFLVALAVTIVVLILAWLSGRRITRPIRQLTRVAAAVREGDLEASAPVAGEDEVGRLGVTFNEMTSAIRSMTGDLRAAAREEHDLRERIETIIQSMADALVAVDAEGRIVAFNAEAEVMMGRDASDVLGCHITEVLSVVDSQGSVVRLPIYSLSEGSVGGVFLQRRRRDPVPVAVTSAALRDEAGDVAGGVAVLRDMTREREVERLKSEFLSNISHELRTPLTPIKGYAGILAHSDVPVEKQRHFASGILESSVRLERIVGLLVDFASLEAGRVSPHTKVVDVSVLLERLKDEWSTRTKLHDIETEIESDLFKVVGDERLLRRSVEEIIDNAVKFSPEGGSIRLCARNAPPNGSGAPHRIEVSVVDQGIGIGPEDLERVFSDFHQIDGSQTRTFGGLGLGLAFVRRIVEAHDGTVEAESNPERGTRMVVRLPSTDS